jgi:predicted short-subunit dehydrogenase-like oxidoreductase (DUF2520 family)
LPKTEFHIAIIGSGNMAFAMSRLFSKKHKIVQVVSRNKKSGKKLAHALKCPFSSELKDVYAEADFYLLCVPDDQIAKVSKQLKHVTGVVVHHSGAQALKAISQPQKAVIYPFVSVNTETKLNSSHTAVFYHTEHKATGFLVKKLLSGYKFHPAALKDDQRLKLHLAGVLVNNFTNHLYEQATHITRELPQIHSALTELAQQALENLVNGTTKTHQTGPARRNDKGTMKKHLELIKKDRELSEIYVSLSRSIYKTYHHE